MWRQQSSAALLVGLPLVAFQAVGGIRSFDLEHNTVSNEISKVSSSCGVKGGGDQVQASIVNGDNTSACEWRWQVGLSGGVGNMPFCGGSLISDRWVLTASHCVTEEVKEIFPTMYVQVGDIFGYSYKAIEVERIHAHPGYNPKSLTNDIALVRLSSPAPMGNCVGTVCLPEQGQDVKPGTKCWATGYGKQSTALGQPSRLLEAPMVTKRSTTCNFLRLWVWGLLTKTTLCAQGDRGWFQQLSGATCQGDSGGPLVCEEDGRWTIYGATSFGSSKGCGDKFRPSVWSRVHANLDWLRCVMAAKTEVEAADCA